MVRKYIVVFRIVGMKHCLGRTITRHSKRLQQLYYVDVELGTSSTEPWFLALLLPPPSPSLLPQT